MSNTFYTNTLSAVPSTAIRSAAVKSQLSSIETGFSAVDKKIQQAVVVPTGEQPFTLPPRSTLVNKVIGIDATGNGIGVVVATTSQVESALNAAATATAQATVAASQAALAVSSATALAATVATVAATIVNVTTTSITAGVGNHYIIRSETACTITLPANPTITGVIIVTIANDRNDNIIARADAASTIMGLTEDLTLNVRAVTVTLKAVSLLEWRII